MDVNYGYINWRGKAYGIKTINTGYHRGIIGWITNLLAIKMLFRPFKPVNVPLVNFKIQGLIPKRKAEIAESIGETVETELLSIEEIVDELVRSNNKTEILSMFKNKIEEIIKDRLPSVVPSVFKE